jgi:hypothetical protein
MVGELEDIEPKIKTIKKELTVLRLPPSQASSCCSLMAVSRLYYSSHPT